MRRGVLLSLLGLGCADGPPPAQPPQEGAQPPSVSAPQVGDAPTLPEAEDPGRLKKRMTVAQARDSMERIAGGVVWGGGDESDWDAYAATLGVADYQLRTTSDRSPSVLFQKFLADAAVHTCGEWMAAPDSSFFAIDDPGSTAQDQVRANVAALRWRIQGRPMDEQVPAMDDYVELFATVYRRSGSTTEAWQVVCVAMFTHPDFFIY